jgi:hypothetical protein
MCEALDSIPSTEKKTKKRKEKKSVRALNFIVDF